MNSLSAINPYALKRMGIPVILEPDYSHRFTTVFFDSKCHEYEGDWTPEVDSPRCGGMKGKFHWQGSQCSVINGKFAFVHKARILDGNDFNRLERYERCGTCDQQFHLA